MTDTSRPSWVRSKIPNLGLKTNRDSSTKMIKNCYYFFRSGVNLVLPKYRTRTTKLYLQATSDICFRYKASPVTIKLSEMEN